VGEEKKKKKKKKKESLPMDILWDGYIYTERMPLGLNSDRYA
jgi:hypothetical protein